MKALIRVTLALAAVASFAVFAAVQSLPTPDPAAHAAAVAARQARVSAGRANRAAQGGKSAADVAAVNSTVSGPRVANAFRAYPPSCAADPLPTTPTGPTTTTTVPLYTRDINGQAGAPEDVTITLWRMACSSSGNLTPYNTDGGFNAILLMRIDRSLTTTDVLPTFPSVTSTQGSTAINLVRSALEPNTVVSEMPFDSTIADAQSVYVLENYPFPSFGFTYFDYAFDLTIDPVLDNQGTGSVTLPIGDYQPTQSAYPAAFQNLPIDGYMSSAWYDTAHSGEGLMVQIYDNADNATRTLFAAWYTYDDAGIPFWLSIQGVAAYGSNTFSNVPVYYYTGGGFAGNFSGVTQNNWGTMNFSFSDCMTMNFDFDGAATGVAGGPAGSGSRTFTRLADINGLNCE
jgi:hypothetical protein